MTEIRRWLINAEHCRGSLDNAPALLESMRTGCSDSGAIIRREAVEPYVPHGVTAALVLAESHFVVSTWPEWQFCTLDISVCSDQLDLQVLVQPVLALLDPVSANGRLTQTRLPEGRMKTTELAVTMVDSVRAIETV